MTECRKHGTIEAEILHICTKRAHRNAAVTKKWHIQESDYGYRQRSVADSDPLPVEGQEYDRLKFHCYSQSQSEGRNCPPSALQRSGGHHQQ
jgi:hypothetical protein